TILACLEDGVSTIPRIVAKIYGELDADLKAAAALSVLAHLEHMINRGLAKVVRTDLGARAEAELVADLSVVYYVSMGASAPAACAPARCLRSALARPAQARSSRPSPTLTAPRRTECGCAWHWRRDRVCRSATPSGHR